MLALNSIFGDIDPETIDRQTLVRVIEFRDFRRFPTDLIERLTDRVEQEFGRHAPQQPVFDLPPWEKKIHLYFQTHRSEQLSRFEINLTLMAKIRYLHWMKEYQDAPLAQKRALMSDVREDMRYWQAVYLDYVRYLEQPEPTELELLLESQRMIENFKVDASPENAKLIDSFAQSIVQSVIAAEASKKAAAVGEFIRGLFGGGRQTNKEEE